MGEVKCEQELLDLVQPHISQCGVAKNSDW